MTTTPEALTPEERALIGSDTSNEDANAVHLARKLLRIHDRQAARIAELEAAAEYRDQCALERSERE